MFKKRRKFTAEFTELRFLGSRQVRKMLVDMGWQLGRGRVRALMRKMRLMAVFQKPRTGEPGRGVRYTPISYGMSP